jgi:hypothetical protein
LCSAIKHHQKDKRKENETDEITKDIKASSIDFQISKIGESVLEKWKFDVYLWGRISSVAGVPVCHFSLNHVC